MNQFPLSITLTIINYLIGSISSAKIISRYKKKVDITEVGFKTAGGSNVAESIGLKWGILVGLFDLIKGVPVLLLAKFLLLDENWLSLIGVSAIIGHCWPIWFNFSGGRGLATFFGTCVILTPNLAIYPLLAFVLTLPLWLLRRYKIFKCDLLSSPTLTLTGLIIYLLLTLQSKEMFDNIFSMLSLIIIIVRRISARSAEYRSSNPIKLFFSRLIFDSSEVIQ